MASTSTIRSPPTTLSSPIPDQSGEPCPFRRSRSRIFYDSEISTGTSWEFRGIVPTSDSPIHHHQLMQLSLLRSPVLNGMVESPVAIAGVESSSVHFRSIPSPTKDDLGGNGSDGSRNSTGSSSASHRSQDSGFSDSGEARPSRKSPLSIKDSSIALKNSNLHPNSHLSPNRSNQYNENCSQMLQHDPNKNYLQSSSQQSHNRSLSFQVERQQESPSIYVQPHPNLVHHERCYSTPVPSPIPHSGSGCGKLILKNTSSNFHLSKPSFPHQSPYQVSDNHQAQHLHRLHQGNYADKNGNSGAECPNCIYQEVPIPSQPNSPPYQLSHYNQNQNKSSHSNLTLPQSCSTPNYSLYSPIPPVQENHSNQLGVPVCSSTPKRSNVSATRLTIMQKIDNFESLNKNKKSLDNNNNSHNNSSKGSLNSNIGKNETVAILGNGQVGRSLVTNASPSSQQTHGVSPSTGPTASLYDSPKGNKKSLLSLSKKNSSKLSISSLSSSSSNQHQNQSTNNNISSSSTLSVTTDFCSNENKTVVHRPSIPIPKQYSSSSVVRSSHQLSPISISHDNVPEEDNNNNWTINESSQYASQSKLKDSKWQSLPRGYKRVPLKGFNSSSILSSEETSNVVDVSLSKTQEKVIIVKSHFGNDAMRLWLHELRSQTESECLHLLQTKTILPPETCTTVTDGIKTNFPESKGVSNIATSETDSGKIGNMSEGPRDHKRKKSSVVDAIHGISSPMMSIKNVERMASVVSGEFAKICKNIEFGFLSQVPTLVLSLISHVEEFLKEFQGSNGFGNLQKLENKLSRSCRRLNRSANAMIEVMSQENSGSSTNGDHNNIYAIIEPESCGESYQVAVNEVVGGIVTVGNLFSQVVDLRLTRDLSCILDTIEKGGIPAKVALKSFASVLSDGGNHLCRLASEIRTVRGLLGVILDARDDYDKIISLRCLATILCVGEAVKDFDRAGGFEIVADFMYESIYPLEIKIEAVSVLTQATDPWIDLESSLYSLGVHLEKIVIALTYLIRDFKSSEESFLLVVAAISNLTFLEVSSIEILRRCNTVAILLEAVETAECNFSVFVLDHVATILANMAGVESCRADIVRSGGVHSLLNFLQRRPSPTKESAAEIMACERVQQKSTIAISRLCTEDGVAKFILERGGIHRLVMLSRNEKERNYSDGVLIAALATLRKILSVCGSDVIKGLQAEDLIQPRLLDSFLLYSSRQESYV